MFKKESDWLMIFPNHIIPLRALYAPLTHPYVPLTPLTA